MNSKIWYEYEDREKRGFVDEKIVACHLGKVYHWSEGRNAWWRTRIQRFYYCAFFSSTQEDAIRSIEVARVQGSQWTLFELPAVVVSGKTLSLSIFEINTLRPLGNCELPTEYGNTLESIGDLFQPQQTDSIMRIVSNRGTVPPAVPRFKKQHSRSLGGGRELAWETSQDALDIGGVEDLVAKIKEKFDTGTYEPVQRFIESSGFPYNLMGKKIAIGSVHGEVAWVDGQELMMRTWDGGERTFNLRALVKYHGKNR